MNHRSLTLVVHGEGGVGKSWLADTTPAPRLVFDVEGGVRFTPSRKVLWDGVGPPPAADGTWDTCVVTTTSLDTLRRALQWFTSGQHPFKSVVIDSLTEAQKRHVDDIAGTKPLAPQHYGDLLRTGDALVRTFRDLTLHPTKPLDVVVFVCGTREKGQEHPVMRPALLGQLAEMIGYHVDVMTYLTVEMNGDGDLVRRAQFVPVEGVAAKDRTGRLGATMQDPTVPKMLDAVYGPAKEVSVDND